MKKAPSRATSAFRIVMIALTLAAVWVTVRQLRPSRTQRQPRPGLQINGRPVSLENSSPRQKLSAHGKGSTPARSALASGSWNESSAPVPSSQMALKGRNAFVNQDNIGRPGTPGPPPAPSAPRPQLDGHSLSDDLESPSDPYLDFLMSVGSTDSDDTPVPLDTVLPDPTANDGLAGDGLAEQDETLDLIAPVAGAPAITDTPPIMEPHPVPASEPMSAEDFPSDEDSPLDEDPGPMPAEISPPSPSDRPAPLGDSAPGNGSSLLTDPPNERQDEAREDPFAEPAPEPIQELPAPKLPTPELPAPIEAAPAPMIREPEPAWDPYGHTIIESTSPVDATDWEIDPAPHWELTLREAIEVALVNHPEVDVARLSSSIAGTRVGIERGQFDPVGGMSFYGGQDDRLARNNLQTFNASSDFIDSDLFGPLDGLNNFFVRQNLQSGGNFEFGFGTNYQRYFPVGADLLVPSGWESTINFQFNQPLLRGRGRDVALRRVLVAKAQTDQARYESQVAIRKVIRDVELAYWQLASAHARLRASQKYVKLGIEFERMEFERQGRNHSALPHQLQTRSLLSDFRVAHRQARRDTNIAEMKLRTAMGLAGQSFRHCHSIVDSLVNTDFPIRPDIEHSAMPVSTDIGLATAKAMGRPIFGVPRARIHAAQHHLAAAKNSLLPQVDATALYQKSGLNDNLDSSVSTLFNERFDTWAVGLTYQQSAYRRSSKASVRRFQLTISQEQANLDALANEVAGDLQRFKADLEGSYDTFQARKDQVHFLAQQVDALNELYQEDKVSLFQRLEIARALQAAEIEAVEVWGQMQAATARYRFTRGDQPEEYGVALQIESP